MYPKSMKAAVARRFGAPLVIEEIAVPALGPKDVLVRVAACGVCHTDLHAVNGDWPVKPLLPLIPGHEGAGTVVAIGSDVRNVREGDRVGVPWLHDACGHCDHCWSGWETVCASVRNTGYGVPGGFAEYVVGHADYLGLLPDRLDFAAAAPILCAGVTVYKGLKETDTRPGQTVVISGIGGLGHLAVQYAKAMGLHVVALDVHPMQLDLARRLGAELCVDARDPDAVRDAMRQVGGAHGALVTAVSPAAFSQALSMLRPRGTMALVGLPPGDFPVPIFDVVLTRKTIRGSIVGTREDLFEALQFAAEGKAKANFTTEPLDRINSVFDRMRAGTIEGRVVLQIGP
ncbi:MAG TPA: alcohol dehydrogenase AdhP [Rudaea sp.]